MDNEDKKKISIGVLIIVIAGIIMLIVTIFFSPFLENIRDCIASPVSTPTLTTPPPDPPTDPTPEPTAPPTSTPDPTSTPEPTPPLVLKLENAVSIGDKLTESNNVEDNYGGTHLSAFQISRTYSSFAFETLLDGQYKTFTATLFAQKGSTFSGTCQVQIIVDGETIFADELTKTSRPIAVDIPIPEGGNVFQIKTNYATYSFPVYIADARLLP